MNRVSSAAARSRRTNKTALKLEKSKGKVDLYIVRIWFENNAYQVNDHSNEEQTAGEQIQNAHSNFSFIKFMSAHISEKQAQEQ